MQQACFAAGCFWGVQHYFDQIPGVVESSVGYTGGIVENPSYEEVCQGTTGHAEAVLISFDADKVTYVDLVRHFFRMHDASQHNRQGLDVGEQYRSAIFTIDRSQYETAGRIADEYARETGRRVATVIEPLGPFYEAEDYHQQFTHKTGRGACHIPYAPLSRDSSVQ